MFVRVEGWRTESDSSDRSEWGHYLLSKNLTEWNVNNSTTKNLLIVGDTSESLRGWRGTVVE